MKIRSLFALTLGVALVPTATLAGPSPSQERGAVEITLEDLPEAARTAVQKKVKDGEIQKLERDEKRGKTVYEVEFRAADGQEHELEVSEDGEIWEHEKERESED